MRVSRFVRLVALAVAVVTGCGGPVASPVTSLAPTSAPTQTASTRDAVDAIDALVASMAASVRTGDRSGYLAHVDLSDPVFALEHTRWADEWSGPKPAIRYDLAVTDITIEGETATGQLSVTWRLAVVEADRVAKFAARFTHGADGWRYAGETWIATDTPHFRILVAPGLEATAPAIVADLPGVFDLVTTTLGYVPAGIMEIKEYADGDALVANTLLSLPTIRGWNEPGEALKLRVDPVATSLAPVIAHEFSHFAGFDRAGTHRTRMTWWLDEGVATFVAATYQGNTGDDRLAPVVAWAKEGKLASWADMAVFETTPRELWRFAYPQGYAMVRYVTGQYGPKPRNAWLAAMAIEMDIDGATPAILGVTFDKLDSGFRAWLLAQ